MQFNIVLVYFRVESWS